MSVSNRVYAVCILIVRQLTVNAMLVRLIAVQL